jgi:CHAT domain-containing protein
MLTLWKIPDLETAMLMEDFYSRWKPNTDPARALRAAKLELVNLGVPPKAWAAVVLSGE